MHFLSYSHQSETAVSDVQWLASAGLDVWYDRGIQGGSDWQEEIAAAIQDSDAFICYLSEDFLKSTHCLNELSFAVGCDKRLVPVYETPLQLPAGLQLTLGRTQALARHALPMEEFRQQLLDAITQTSPDDHSTDESAHAGSAATLAEWSGDFRARSEQAREISRRNCSIAIAPLKDLSQDPEKRFVAEGMSEDLNMFLSRNPDVDVVNLVAQGDESYLASAVRHNVQYLVEGNLSVQGDRLALGAKLVDVDSRLTIWSERYMREVHDLFEVQGEVIRDLASVLGPAIWHSEGQRVAQQNPSDLRVWELIHEANFVQFNLYSRETSAEAERLTRKAIEIEPAYALALATLAQILGNRVSHCLSEDPAADMLEAKEASAQALALAPRDARVLLFAAVPEGASGNIDKAIYLAKTAAELDPIVGALGYLGVMLIFARQPEEGIELINEELRRDPHSGRRYLGLSNLALGYTVINEHEKARQCLEEALILHPNSHMTYLKYALCLDTMGDDAGAVNAMRRVREIDPAIPLERYLKTVRSPNSKGASKAGEAMQRLWQAAAPA